MDNFDRSSATIGAVPISIEFSEFESLFIAFSPWPEDVPLQGILRTSHSPRLPRNLTASGCDAPYQMSLRIIRESHTELPGGCADGKLGNPGRL